MLVKTREKSKAMFTRKRLSAACSGIRNIHASRFASLQAFELIYMHIEASLDELMCGTHPGDPAPENNYFFIHKI
jgi:hypothetical protein